MRKIILTLCFLMAAPLCAQAASDIIATYKYADGSMVTLCTRDANRVRMDTSPTSYMLLKDRKSIPFPEMTKGSGTSWTWTK